MCDFKQFEFFFFLFQYNRAEMFSNNEFKTKILEYLYLSNMNRNEHMSKEQKFNLLTLIIH